jgi:succinate dehydrogenase / fumarate reductase, cytochrome b subunit
MRRYLFSYIREAALNNRAGMWAWLLQRLSGLALAAYLLPHLIVLASARQGGAAFDRLTTAIQTPIWHVFDIGLLAVFLVHAGNGLRIVIVDTGEENLRQKFWLRVVGALAAAAMIAGTVSLVEQMIHHV